MRTTLMAQEASASPEKIALQLEKNNKTWRHGSKPVPKKVISLDGILRAA